MQKDNPACFTCPKGKQSLHTWKRRPNGRAFCTQCGLTLTKAQTADCFRDMERPMCPTDVSDRVLKAARAVQDARKCKPAIIPVRDEVDVALGKLMAAIEDAHAEATNSNTGFLCQRAINTGFSNIVNAKLRYDAARLAKGDRTPPPSSTSLNRMNRSIHERAN